MDSSLIQNNILISQYPWSSNLYIVWPWSWHLTHYRKPTTAPPRSTINNTIATHQSTTIAPPRSATSNHDLHQTMRPMEAWFKGRERKKRKGREIKERQRRKRPMTPRPSAMSRHHQGHAIWSKIHQCMGTDPHREGCKHKFSKLQKIKQLKRNMACKYKFVLMYNEYNLYFNSFTKEYPLILSSLNLTQTRDLLDFGWKMDWMVFSKNL